jgi:hypothetical protein
LGPIESINDSSDDSLGVKDTLDMGGGGEWSGRGANVIIMNIVCGISHLKIAEFNLLYFLCSK